MASFGFPSCPAFPNKERAFGGVDRGHLDRTFLGEPSSEGRLGSLPALLRRLEGEAKVQGSLGQSVVVDSCANDD